ncbi:MAG TPA: peroxiredoxin-like family protein [Candidatus Angelobacter sp.]|jgi:peroxiredoxin|nr:peroxiredoxin-like family protein [Candidatus Angelobacter sp.]
MTLADQLEELTTKLRALVPAERLSIVERGVDALKQSKLADSALKTGDMVPEFELHDGDGMLWRSVDLLRSGPLVVVFYRGRWCAYCNTQLAALQEIHSQIATTGASLVAISPQTQKHSYMTRDMHGLRFPVLSDPGNTVARQFGLVYGVTPELRRMYESIMTKLPGYNGDQSWELPMPATYVIGQDGNIIFGRVDVDWRERPEPEEILSVLNHRGHREAQRG